jgi:hypothetical protein
MSTSTLYRLSAWCLIGSFVLSLAGGLAHPVVDGESHSVEVFLAARSPWAQYLIYAGAVLLMLGLPGGYLWVRERVGVLGLVGFVGYMLGNALSAMAHLVVEAFVGPALAADPDAAHLVNATIVDTTSFVTLQAVGGVVFVLSLVVIVVALTRAGVLPVWTGVLLALGVLAVMVPFPERPVLTGLLVEVPRGVLVATLGALVLRGLRTPDRAATPSPSPVPVQV